MPVCIKMYLESEVIVMKKTRKLMAALLVMCLLPGLFGCSGRYKVICSDKKEWSGLKSSYREGESVVIYYQVSVTESTLNIVVDGVPVDYDFDGGKGYRVEFTMPAHDVEIKAVWTHDGIGA